MNPPCPECKSFMTAKDGKKKTGVQRYRCQSCKKRFQDKYKPARVRTGKPCYYCGKPTQKHGRKKDGERRYRCPECRRYWLESTLQSHEVRWYDANHA